jgi:hypothetical protein
MRSLGQPQLCVWSAVGAGKARQGKPTAQILCDSLQTVVGDPYSPATDSVAALMGTVHEGF